jgi:hypothetical protein
MAALKKVSTGYRKVLLRIGGDLLAKVDAYAKKQDWPGNNRSEALRGLIAKGLEVK